MMLFWLTIAAWQIAPKPNVLKEHQFVKLHIMILLFRNLGRAWLSDPFAPYVIGGSYFMVFSYSWLALSKMVSFKHM